MRNLLYDQIIEIWKRFCELHFELYDATCDEYQLLLESNIDSLEEKIKDKVEIINQIKRLEKQRQETIENLNKSTEGVELSNVSALVQFMQTDQVDGSYRDLLNRYNKLLVDIIQKIQAQNKKNQAFINKSIHNLRSIREEITGKKTVSTYNSSGKELRTSSMG